MAIDFGYDASGRGNNWTANNLSSTAGVGNDSLVDVPTSYGSDTGVGGEVRGNYCTMNPLNAFGFASGAIANGNLDVGNGNGSVYAGITSTMRIPTTVPIYAEFTVTSLGLSPNGPRVGITSNNTVGNTASRSFGNSATEWVLITSTGDKRNSGSTTSYGTGFSINDVGMLAVDTANGKVWFGKNGTWFNSGAPASGTNAAYTNVSGEVYIGEENDSDDSVVWNFGQRAFAYTAPSGFKALCTQNLPTPTIGATSTTQANDYFNAVLYTGDDTNRTIDCGLQTDFIWTKGRNAAVGNRVSDSVRGASGGLMYNLVTNLTSAENTDTAVTGIVSNGFTLTGGNHPNNTGTTYVAWGWKANGAGGSNTAGTITSTVSANTTAGFSIITWTGNTTGGATIGHGLGVTPQFFFMKNRAGVTGWPTYHAFMDASAPQNYYISMASTDAKTSDSAAWNNTAPTSSVITLGSGSFSNGSSMVAYVFAPVAGYSAFGSYTGNGSTDGPFVYTGFRPRYLMIKVYSGSTGSWWIWDAVRNTYNAAVDLLAADLSQSEINGYPLDFLSNGFKLRNTTAQLNGSGYSILYAAFAESPFKYALAR